MHDLRLSNDVLDEAASSSHDAAVLGERKQKAEREELEARL